MKTSDSTGKSRWLKRIGLVLGGLLLCYLFPLFHIVPLKAALEQSAQESFDADEFIEAFWSEQLPTVSADAVEIETLRFALAEDSASAIEQYGHRLGVSARVSYFVSGHGEIREVTKRAVEVSLSDGSFVMLGTGPIFGNTIRDGSGLFDVSDFANSQEFNALSTEINRRVEERILPDLRELGIKGKQIRFVGGVDISDSNPQLDRLKVVPIKIEFP